MAKKLKKIVICSMKADKNIRELALQAIETLSNSSVDVYVNDELSKLSKISKFKQIQESDYQMMDLMIVIGGDGSILGYSREYGSLGVPILGINLGKLGFLADIPPENISNTLLEVVNGKYTIDKRAFLEVTINGEGVPHKAVNEVVIHSGLVARLMEYELSIDKSFVYRQKADGLIINTPTGSTAYSLSGGGPILHPSVNAITLLPMFPHSLSTSPLLVKDNSFLSVKIISKNKASINIDGQVEWRIKMGDTIEIQKSKVFYTLIHPKDHNFFSACRTKLGWSIGIIDE